MSKASTSTKSASRDTPTRSADRGTTASTTSESSKRANRKPAEQTTPPRGTEKAGAADPTTEPRRRNPFRSVGAAFGRGWRSLFATRVTAVVLAVVLAGALSAGGYAGWKVYQHRQADAARNAAVSAAKTTVSNFMSISNKTVDQDLNRVLSGATGDFRTQFKNGMGQTKSAVVENKVTAKAHVLWAGVVTSKPRSATVLVAMDATVKNTNAPKGRLAHYRVQVTMAEQNGRWLVSSLKFV